MDDVILVTHPAPYVTVITINRPRVLNAVDGVAAAALAAAFRAFDTDPSAYVALLTGAGGNFCAGADLKAVSAAATSTSASTHQLSISGDGPMGPSRLSLSKPVIACVSGYAVAGGLELAVWCDLRVVDDTARLGVFCRRVGVPLIDGGTVRLPRLIGQSRAMDLIITGREVSSDEALRMGLANYRADFGRTALDKGFELAQAIVKLPQATLRADLLSARVAFDGPVEDCLRAEFERGVVCVRSDGMPGAAKFVEKKAKL